MQYAEHITHAFADCAGYRPAHRADHPPSQAMAIFVPDNIRVQITITVRICCRPDIHLHARVAAITRGSEIGIIGAAAILGFSIHRVAASAAIAKVVFLEIQRAFYKAVAIKVIMNKVVQVKQVLNGDGLVRRL